MKLKTRILLALGLMTLLIAMLSIASTYFIQRLGTASEHIMKDNFKSIYNANMMASTLDEMDNALYKQIVDPKHYDLYHTSFIRNSTIFDENLKQAESNVTEPGEQLILTRLHKRYEHYIALIPIDVQTYLTVNALAYDSLKVSCIELFNVNKKGMDIRNSRAKDVSNEAALL